MNNIVNTSYLLVDLDVLRQNVRAILDSLAKGVRFYPVLKDDAFGLGLEAVARVLMEFPEIDTMAVAYVPEGIALRRAGFPGDVLVMGGTPRHLIAPAIAHGLTLTVGRLGFLQFVRDKNPVKVQIKLETGLNRSGLKPGEELRTLIEELREAGEQIIVTGAFSHFADSDDTVRTQKQYEIAMTGFAQLEQAGVPIPRRHISASAASERYPQYNLDAVRVGRRLYMDHYTRPVGNIREVASWRGWITNLRSLKAGDALGYGKDCRLSQNAVIATVAAGYGDGLSRDLVRAHGPVLAGGRRAKLLACSMDHCFVDVTDLDCSVDDEVTFFGHDGKGAFLPSQEVALLVGDDEGCGLTCALSNRVTRLYQGVTPATR